MNPNRMGLFLLPTALLPGIVQSAQSIDDASRLNDTIVSEIVDIRSENDIRMAITKAHMLKTHISIAGRRHTMGGQTFEKGNIILNMLPFRELSYDAKTGILTAQAGATWAQIQSILDPLGRSVWVMQSDNVFSVGGTVSVNAHGWQPRQGPISSTVESFRILLASGEIKTCSRSENAVLFHAALGGYGLLGVILDVRLQTVPNKLYRQESFFFPAEEFAQMFEQRVSKNPSVELAFGRFSIDRKHFLSEVGLHTFEAMDPQPAALPSMENEDMVKFKNYIFRRSAKNDAGKRQRWALEKHYARHRSNQSITRNTVMHPDFRVIWHPVPESRDILHEYFIPYAKVNEFVESLRQAVQAQDLNLLNVTLRDVKKDQDSLLSYADTDRCALVLFFSQPPTAGAEESMRHFTGDMVDRALALGGSYYLPYRLHYSEAQFRKAYPRAGEFSKIKARVDPETLFTSQFFRHNFL